MKKEPSKYPITLALKPELIERIDAAAKELGMTRAGYIRFCVIQRLNKDE